MALRMAKLKRDPSSGSWLSRKEIPKDLREPYAAIYNKRREEIFRAPADCPAARAKVMFSKWQSEIDSRFAALRAKQRGQGRDLTQRQAHALVGEWYRWFTAQHDENPGHPDKWRDRYKGWDAYLLYSAACDAEAGVIDLEAPGAREELYAPLAEEARTDEFLISRGETLTPAAMITFLDRVLWAYPKAINLLERRAKGDYSPDPHLQTLPEYKKPEGPKGPSEPLGATGPSLSASQLFEAYIRAAKLAPETIIRRRVVFTALDAHLAGRAFDALSDEEAQEWITSRVTDKRSALTVQKIYIASLKAIGRWAVRQKDISVSRNPFEECSIVVPRKARNRETRAFTTDEMHTILSAAIQITAIKNTTQATRRWVPWICGYTGARAGEVTQLRAKDVIDRDGVKAIRITPEAGTLKTKQARVVPIHEHLIAQGLLEYVKTRGNLPLFYDAQGKQGPQGQQGPDIDITNPRHSRAVHVRSSLARWIRSIGITDPEVSPTHGWRHTFKQIANRHDISDRESDAITGHAPPTEGRKYGAATLEDMAEALKLFPRYKIP
jgi:integrase